jgi:hypothetical protein
MPAIEFAAEKIAPAEAISAQCEGKWQDYTNYNSFSNQFF